NIPMAPWSTLRSGVSCRRSSKRRQRQMAYSPSPDRPGQAQALAVLLADAGAVAAGPEFFRSSEFYAAEGVTHSLVVEIEEDRQLIAPLLVREIPGGDGILRDAISPYGYPGFTVSGPSQVARGLDPATVDWSETGLVSIFIRHRL